MNRIRRAAESSLHKCLRKWLIKYAVPHRIFISPPCPFQSSGRRFFLLCATKRQDLSQHLCLLQSATSRLCSKNTISFLFKFVRFPKLLNFEFSSFSSCYFCSIISIELIQAIMFSRSILPRCQACTLAVGIFILLSCLAVYQRLSNWETVSPYR